MQIRKIVFIVNRETMTFLVVNRKIFYTDRKFKMLIRVMPKPKNLITQIQLTRNRVPPILAKLFEYSKEEIEQYNNAKDDDALANIIVEDARSKGCILVANGIMEADDTLMNEILKSEVIA